MVDIEGRYPSNYDYPMSKQTHPKDGDPMLYIESLGYGKKLKKNKFLVSFLELMQKSFAWLIMCKFVSLWKIFELQSVHDSLLNHIIIILSLN